MLMWALLLHLAIHLLSADNNAPSPQDTAVRPIDRHYVVRPIKTCPEEGYFFQKEKLDNQNYCFLCFCKSEHTALCWKRDNKRCDSSTFNHHEVGKRPRRRVRRSAYPFGLSDLFFRDTARSLFNKDTKQECKPHESSFSEGCPPKDWCVGCTVCDCDVNGHWDCHILSFCPEKKSGSKGKRRVQKVTPKPKTFKPSPKRTKNVPKKTTPKKSNTKPTNHRRASNQPKGELQRNMVKKTLPNAGTKKPVVKSQVKHTKKKMVTQKTVAPKFINKQIRPMKIKKGQGNKLVLNEHNSTVKLAQQILASVMMAAKRKVRNQMRNVGRNMFVTTKPMKKPGKRQVQKKNSPKKVLVKKYRIRNKRDLPASHTVVDNNASMLIVTEEASLFNKSSSITNLDENVNTILDFHNQSKYYTYTIENNQGTTKTSDNKSNNEVNNTEPVLHFLTTRKMDSLRKEPVKIKRNSSETSVHTSIIVNDVKSNSNYSFKNIEDNVSYNMETQPKPRAEFIKNYTYENRSVLPLIRSKDISREPASKKYQIVKVVPHKSKSAELKKDRSTMQQMIRDKIVAMHKTAKTLFSHVFINNDTSMHTTKRKHKKITLIKYMKKFFNKVFLRKQYNTESQAIKSLCEAFGRCQLNDNEKRVIRLKLKSLNKEASNILKSIGIIKGLLHLIPIPLKNITRNTTTPSLGNDLQKLESILKGTYNLDNNYKLSETDLVQINYVKKNTQDFIQSMSKLATKLDEIIAIIKNKKKKRRKVTNSKDVDQIKVSIKNPFNRIKSLIMSYNLAHNKFMEKLEKALKDIEYNFKDKRVQKVSDDDNKNINKIVAVEVFSRNIINNLRHLKGLAQNMIFNNRNKRSVRSVTRENESMEYLLMLMEYLMKRSHPLNNAPAHDGIDLLIDAIKSAPDIKSINKIALKPTFEPTRTEANENGTILIDNIKHKDTHSNNVNTFLRTAFDDYDNQLEVNNSKEDSIKSIFSSSKESDQSLKFDKEVEGNNQLYRNIDSVTVPIVFKHVDNFGKTELVDSFVNTTESLQSLNEFNKQSVNLDYDNSDKFDVIKDGMDAEAKGNENRLNRSESREEENVSKLETDVKEPDVKTVIPETKRKDSKLMEQDLDSSFYNDVILEVKSTVAPKHTTPHFFETETAREFSDKLKPESEYKNKLSESKSPIDWIEENFGIETKTSQRSFQTLKLTSIPSTTEVTVKNTEVTRAATHATSFMAQERKKKKKVINVEDVIFKKQMALLNSLDYGTEKSPFDEADSKDERSVSDSFQAYN